MHFHIPLRRILDPKNVDHVTPNEVRRLHPELAWGLRDDVKRSRPPRPKVLCIAIRMALMGVRGRPRHPAFPVHATES